MSSLGYTPVPYILYRNFYDHFENLPFETVLEFGAFLMSAAIYVCDWMNNYYVAATVGCMQCQIS